MFAERQKLNLCELYVRFKISGCFVCVCKLVAHNEDGT
jgi:hypothetical protein